MLAVRITSPNRNRLVPRASSRDTITYTRTLQGARVTTHAQRTPGEPIRPIASICVGCAPRIVRMSMKSHPTPLERGENWGALLDIHFFRCKSCSSTGLLGARLLKQPQS